MRKEKERRQAEIIETYWNVNLPCRVFRRLQGSEIIETYWNVNYTGGQPSPSPDYEIIETYWNVNEGMEEYIKSVAKGNNRNILECKLL